jgi:hypothetical protein
MATREDQIPPETEPVISTTDGEPDTTQIGGTEPEPTISEPQAPATPEPQAPSFRGTRIEGRSQEEAASYISLLEQTVQEQKDRLTRAESQPAPVAQPDPTEDINFFDDPKAVLRAEIAKAVEPINKQVQAFQTAGRLQTVWSRIEQEIPDFNQYRPLVDKLIEGNGYTQDQISVELLRQLYYTAVGWQNKHGAPQVTTPTPAPTPAPQHIPQHRPSTAPLPNQTSTKPPLRELTENERRLAAEFGQTHEEYLRLQDENLDLEGFNVN